ncbi:junctional adhesion molecule A [Calypte anna]|uniref:junctional adhesion molecule A n=1 Tax=Calypte anna TaxID=9244 RepID=UPI0011C48F5A|nr:junctional adhesion molecule A [Calypte anna]
MIQDTGVPLHPSPTFGIARGQWVPHFPLVSPQNGHSCPATFWCVPHSPPVGRDSAPLAPKPQGVASGGLEDKRDVVAVTVSGHGEGQGRDTRTNTHACARRDEACAGFACRGTPWPRSCESRGGTGQGGGGGTGFSGSRGSQAQQCHPHPTLGTVTAASGLPLTSLPRIPLPSLHLCPFVPAVSLVGAQVTSETREVPEHQSAVIPCSAFHKGWSNPRIEWKFQRGSSLILVYYEDKLTEPYQNRVQFSRPSITLTSVTREDSGKYICEVVGADSQIAKSEVTLIVQVPPSKPVAHVPSSATIGSRAVLRCSEGEGSPPPTFRWYKDGVLLPPDPRTSPIFRNSSYTLDPTTGDLIFDPLSGFDTGDYNCEATNNVGPPQESDVFRLEASEVNVGGIVAAVVVLLMVVALVAFGIWFGYSRGYFSKKKDSSSKKVIYSQGSHRSEGEFKQTSSFLV